MAGIERRVSRTDPELAGVLRFDADRVALSGSLRLDLNVTGRELLRVEVPEDVLAPSSAQVWQIRPLTRATVQELPDGQREWSRSYRLDPFVPGEQTLVVSPLRVHLGGEVFPLEFEAIPIIVTTEVTSTSREEIRPVTDVERLPSGPESAESTGWWLGPFLGLLLAGVAILAWRFLRRPVPPEPPEVWIRGELDRMESTKSLEAVADAWRGYLSRRWEITTTGRTSAELIAEVTQDARFSTAQAQELGAILSMCDIAKFAPTQEHAELSDIVRRSRELLDQLT